MDGFTHMSLLPAGAHAGGRRRRARDLARKRVDALPDAQVAVVAAGCPVRARMPAACTGPRVFYRDRKALTGGSHTMHRVRTQVEAFARAEAALYPRLRATSCSPNWPSTCNNSLPLYPCFRHARLHSAKRLRLAVAARLRPAKFVALHTSASIASIHALTCEARTLQSACEAAL